MRRLTVILSLIAALCGTPLRLAEAAEDLAREMTERDDRSGLEAPDGGIGDDAELIVREAPVDGPQGDAASGTVVAILDPVPTGDLSARSDCPSARLNRPPRDATILLQRFRC